MRHEYLKIVPDNIAVTFTDIHESKTMGENITVHLERPNQNGFDIAESFRCVTAKNVLALMKMKSINFVNL